MNPGNCDSEPPETAVPFFMPAVDGGEAKNLDNTKGCDIEYTVCFHGCMNGRLNE